jgi:hypothetical protein
MNWNQAKSVGVPWIAVVMLLVGSFPFPRPAHSYTGAELERLRNIHTILVAAEASSGPAIAAAYYDVVVTVKIKMEQAGYRVVLGPEQPHDAVLLIEYQELAGREYPNLEIGTKIACTLSVYHPAVGKLFSYHIEAESAWPRPFGSLYWDAVQNFEENAYYYFFGELARGWLATQTDSLEVFSSALREPPLFQSLDGSDNIVTSRMAANQNARLHAIRELGLRRDTRALDTLWSLVWNGNNPERKAAILAIGEIGAPESIETLQELVAGGGPVGSLAAAALERVRARR